MRKLVSLFLLYSLAVMLITGVVLFIMPHGRVAFWTGWTLFGLDKEQWDNIHVIFGFLMVIFGIWHLVLNWKSIVNYMKDNAFIAATVASIVVIVGSAMNVPPFKNFIELGESIKNSWPKPETMPPAPHAELFPLTKIANLLGLSPEEAVKILRENGYKVPSPELKLKEIAKLNSTTPAKIYETLLKKAKRKPASAVQIQPGSGLGMLPLKTLSQKLGIPLEEALKRLKEEGIEASPESSLRELASKVGKHPHELLEVLTGGEYEAPQGCYK